MKIRLLRSLPIEVNHGCQAGTTWEVATIITGKRPRYMFMSEAGKAVVAMNHEAAVVKKNPQPPVVTYEEYYCQPEDFVPKLKLKEISVDEDDNEEPFKPVFGRPKPGRPKK